jgi:hypothetical protein
MAHTDMRLQHMGNGVLFISKIIFQICGRKDTFSARTCVMMGLIRTVMVRSSAKNKQQ